MNNSTLIITGYDSVATDSVSDYRLSVLRNYSELFEGKLEWCGDQLYRAGNESTIQLGSLGRVDTNSYKVLDEIKVVSDNCRFILVYQSPEQVFARSFLESQGDLDVVSASLRAWNSSCEKIHSFFLANREIAVLVEASAPTEQWSDFVGLCALMLGKEVNLKKRELVGSHPTLESYAHLFIANFSQHLNTYRVMQESASLPGKGYPYDVENESRSKQLLKRAGEDILSLYECKSTYSKLDASQKMREKELNLALTQIHQLQEQLERYYIKYEELKAASERKVTQSPDLSSMAKVNVTTLSQAENVSVFSKFSTDGYSDIQLHISKFATSDGRKFDALDCKLVSVDGDLGVEFRVIGRGSEIAITHWPQSLVDEFGQYILYIPSPSEHQKEKQEVLRKELTTKDRQVITGVISVLADHFKSNSIEGAEMLSDAEHRAWRLAACELGAQVLVSEDYVSIDSLHLREEMGGQQYKHLWLDVHGFQFRNVLFPKFSFKLVAVQADSRWKLLLEFRELDNGLVPLEAWPPREKDEFGGKLLVSLLPSSKLISVGLPDQISKSDKKFVASIVSMLPCVIRELAKSEEKSKADWDFWSLQVSTLVEKKVVWGMRSVGLLRRVKRKLNRVI